MNLGIEWDGQTLIKLEEMKQEYEHNFENNQVESIYLFGVKPIFLRWLGENKKITGTH